MIPRQVAALALAALLLGGAGVAAAITHDGGDGEAAQPAQTTTSTPALDTSTTTPTIEATNTTVGSATSTTARAGTTTTARQATTTTVRPGTTTTAGSPDCTPSQIDVTATTDRTSYPAGQQVKVDSTLRNRSQATCFYAGHAFQVAIQDAVGRTIMTFEIATPGGARSPFAPGATLTGSVPWDQRSCQNQPCPQPPPGPYLAEVKWTFAGGPYEAKAAFSLTS